MIRVIFSGDGKADYYREYPEATSYDIEGNWLIVRRTLGNPIGGVRYTIAVVSAFTVKAVEMAEIQAPDLHKLGPAP